MKNLYDWIGYASRKHHHKIRKLIEPLTLFCGVDRFWRNQHASDGSYSLIGDYPPKAEIFFENEFFKGHPYFRHPRFFRSGFVIPELCQNKEYETTQGDFTKRSGDCFHVLLAIQTHAKGFVEYGFATSKFIPGFESTYLNHLHCFKKFIDYFETAGEKIIHTSLDHQVNMSEIIGASYHTRPEITDGLLVPKRELQFLASIEIDSEKSKAILSLSKREREVVGEYLTGGTAKDIAKKIHISPRTLEKHIENAKSKLGVTTRSALFESLMPYQELFKNKLTC